MATNPATPGDLESLGLTISDPPKVETRRLGQAWRALVAEVPSVPDRMDDGSLDIELVRDLVLEAAARSLRNPEGIRRFDASVDDYREGGEYADPTTDIYFKAAELRRVSPPVYGAGSMSF